MRPNWIGAILAALACGCTSSTVPRQARDVSVEQLVRVAEAGPGDQLFYLGTQGGYHYFKSLHDAVAGSYKVRESALPHIDTFRIDDEPPYRMYAHVLEGKPLGRLPSQEPDLRAEW